MKKTISISYGKTINLGNYESARFDAGISMEVDIEADDQNVMDDLMQEVNDFVEAEIKAVKESR